MRQAAARLPKVPLLAVILLSVAAAAPDARADAMPMGMRGVEYKMSVDNLKQFPNHVFVVYPTSNNLYGYVFDPGVPMTSLFLRKTWREGPTKLHAMKKADFDRWTGGKTERFPHGDHDEMVQLVNHPPGPPEALVSNANISPPNDVPDASPLVGIERVFHIKALTDKVFELVLAEEIAVYKDGRREKRKGK